MEPIDDPPPGGEDEPKGLLEECWFFTNLLERKTKAISRCYSDPSPSSSSDGRDLLARNSSSKNSSSGCVRPNFIRTPSLPPCRTREEEPSQEKESNFSRAMSKSTPQSLLRTPSLPPCIGREEDAESDFKLSKLIRQASLNSSDVLPPRHTSKGMKQSSSSAPRNHRLRKKPGLESVDQARVRKNPSDHQFKEVQGFEDLGFTFKKMDLNPGVVNMLPGLQEKSRVESSIEDKVRRPYLPEAWLEQSSAPAIPNWGDKSSSSAEAMKAQIKFWARAVAANVR